MHCTLPEWHGLLAPIASASPVGTDLRSNDLFLQARDIRNAARDSERQRSQGIVPDHSRLLAQWQQVADRCCGILAAHSKDLDVCAWLIEAQTRLHGAQGLADALMLYCELMQCYWNDLFPRPETIPGAGDENIDACVAALEGLNGSSRPGSVVEAINNFRISCCHENDQGEYLLWHYRAALDAQHLADDAKRQQRISLLGYSLLDIQQAADSSETAFYRDQLGSVESAQMALHRLDAVLTQKLDVLAPATAMMRDALGGMHDAISHLAGARLHIDDGEELESPKHRLASASQTLLAVATAAGRQRATPDSNAFPANRDDAIRFLAMIADYFREAEPHSPLAYSIDALVRRARMPFDELMRELIPDPSSRDVFQLMTGVPLAETANP